uniref:Senescence domain-containing protein n=1 Tax=Tetradesmus obliquus TaxID=3088 RepID=A0A383W1M6_TETOB|eukprot:jgi/Sobl393_1/5216/SZX71585.1
MLLQRCTGPIACAAAHGPEQPGLRSPPASTRASTTHSSRLRPASSTASASSTVAVSAPPSPPAPIHTTAYLQQTKQLVQVPVLSTSSLDDDEQQPDLSSNALVWALKKVDDQLNQVEQQPSELHQAIYQFTNGPVGQATSKGVQTAAKFTISATIETAKAAAPIGKWALQQGFKAAVGLVGAAKEQERQQKQRKQKDGK